MIEIHKYNFRHKAKQQTKAICPYIYPVDIRFSWWGRLLWNNIRVSEGIDNFWLLELSADSTGLFSF